MPQQRLLREHEFDADLRMLWKQNRQVDLNFPIDEILWDKVFAPMVDRFNRFRKEIESLVLSSPKLLKGFNATARSFETGIYVTTGKHVTLTYPVPLHYLTGEEPPAQPIEEEEVKPTFRILEPIS